MSTDLSTLGVVAIAEAVRARTLSALAVAEATIAAIRKDNDRLGAYLHVAEAGLLASARALDERIARGESVGVLAGVPIGLKDALATTDMPTTAASKVLVQNGRGWTSPYDATVVARLRAADALLPGKCNLDEFAMGSSTENSAFFPARNPVDDSRTPGGSSGGSAVSVAARMTAGALGSDTGGSIRQPASFTGVVGVKPTYGRVSRYGLIAFASSLDQIGPFATDVRGAARILGVIAGADGRDATCLDVPVPSYEAACDAPLGPIRIGIPAEYFGAGIDPAVEASVRATLDALAAQGATLVPVSLPHTRYAVATYYVLAMAEASTNLSRFDGVRFGLRREARDRRVDLGEMYEGTRGEGFGAEVQRRILLGTYVLSAGYYDAYYRKAQRVRTLIRRDLEAAFREVDVLLAPVAPTPAFTLGEGLDDPLARYLADALTLPASLAGLPALSVPIAKTPARDGRPALPVGLQIIAPHLGEEIAFRLAAAVERLGANER